MRQRFFNHPEELTALWPDVKGDKAVEGRGGIPPWWKAPHPKIGIGMNNGPGHGKFFLHSPRNQRVMVKAVSASNGRPGAWYQHGVYLQRAGASGDGQIGRGFDTTQEGVDLKTTLARWQREGDRHLFKIILSPEHSDKLDLTDYTRRVMQEIARDLGTPLQWAAIDHRNTEHAHVHIVLRGVSSGQRLTMARMYLHGGIKERAQEVATRMLGPRTRREMDHAAERAITRRTWSHLDQSIKAKMDKEQRVEGARLTPHEQRRLEDLEQRGLAWREGEGWRVTMHWEATMDERNMHRKPQEQEQEANRPGGQGEEQKKERAERAADDRHRRAEIVDDLEQELGWGR